MGGGGLEIERERFAKEVIGPITDRNDPVVYIDEVSFHLWITKNRTWMPQNRGFSVPVPPHRGPGITVFMAIGNCLTVPYVNWMADTTNSTELK